LETPAPHCPSHKGARTAPVCCPRFRPHRVYYVHRCDVLLQTSHVAWSLHVCSVAHKSCRTNRNVVLGFAVFEKEPCARSELRVPTERDTLRVGRGNFSMLLTSVPIGQPLTSECFSDDWLSDSNAACFQINLRYRVTDALAREVMQSPPSVRLSVCFHLNF